MFDHVQRRERLWERMAEAGVDLLFVPPSGDLEYLTGMQRRIPAFGTVEYAHHWVTGAFIAAGREPVFVLPRMVREFDLPEGVGGGDIVTVNETDDAVALFAKALGQFGAVRRIGVGHRTWAATTIQLGKLLPDAAIVDANPLVNALRRIKSPDELAAMTRAATLVDGVLADIQDKVREGVTELELASEIDFQMRRRGSRTASFDTAVWAMGPDTERDATVRLSDAALRAGSGVSFDFGSVVDGYVSDFGRTIHIGTPPAEYERVYALVMAAQAAGMAAAKPGATAAQVHAATRQVIVDGGYGRWFRHRTGHCIGMDVHELPFISEEDDTPLEEGMTFTIEPSVFWPGRVGVRVEDVIVCEPGGGRKLNQHPVTLVAND
ncbi:M24 family metallopeptidase [Phytohabitans kaempferiae]|uniref:M24 family metallopeptidase n=1 Tax=Phytohabitans kaempferiae TaxID=1620943 RepID=A0ABV6MB16_9ACTN